MRALAALSAAAVILAAACGGTTPSAVDPALGRVIDVTMREFTFSPATITLAPGEKVTFKLKNTGVVEHDFMAGREATPGKGYALDWIAKATLTVVVPQEKGEYEFGCFVQGHYEAGMKGKLIIQ